MNLSRGWRVALVIVLTILLALPLYQLSNHASAGYYTQQAKDLYHNVTSYFTHPSNVYNNTLYNDGTQNEVRPQFNFTDPCEGFPDTSGILLLMKTGGTESFDKIPIHLLTTMSCLPDFLIFSDLEQQMGKYHIYDVLDRVDTAIKNDHPEFELYAAEQRCPISQKDCTTDMPGGWDLDKYKFLNMVERTWEMRPGMDWYVFAESDTYVVWPNMIQWLRERAPDGDSYIGSVAMLNDVPFAHGGSGYVISGSLMRHMVEDIPDLGAKYDERAGSECCGDFLMSLATQEAGTKVLQAHPMFNGEKPNTLPFGPGQWCEPLLTMHHVNPEEISMIWQFEQTRTNKSEPMQIKDIYHAFVAPHLATIRRDWDNLSDETCYIGPEPDQQERVGDQERERQRPQEDKNPVEAQAHLSAAACAKVCEASGIDINPDEYNAFETDIDRGRYVRARYDERIRDDEDHEFRRNRSCFQWRYQKGACCTSNSIKLGAPKNEDNEDDRWTSGWFARGINDWVEARGPCETVEWKEPY